MVLFIIQNHTPPVGRRLFRPSRVSFFMDSAAIRGPKPDALRNFSNHTAKNSADANITFFRRDEKDQKMKEIVLTNAYLVQFTETLDATGGNPMTISFVLSARKLQIGNAEL